MTAVSAAYVHINGYDALVVVDPDNGNRMHIVGDAETFRQAAYSPGDLDNWSGEPIDEQPEDFEAVLVTHDAAGSRVVDAYRLAQRHEFYRA